MTSSHIRRSVLRGRLTVPALALAALVAWQVGAAHAAGSPPEAYDSYASGVEDHPIDVVLTAYDPDGETLSYSIEAAPAHGTLDDCSSGFCTYSPDLDFFGTDVFTFSADDGELSSNVATVTVDVGEDVAPIADDSLVVTTVDTPISIWLSAVDPNGLPLSFEVVSPPTSGTLDDCTFGSCTYTPNAGFQGVDSFTFTATDGVFVSNVGTLSVSVSPGATTIASPGPLDEIIAFPDLGCQVAHVDDDVYEFYPPGSSRGACATELRVGDETFGPSEIPAGNSPTPFTPISISAVTGSGTQSDPFAVTTEVAAGDTGLTIRQTDSYVVGLESYRTDVTVINDGGTPVEVILYRAGDCYLQGSDLGFGAYDPTTGAVSCVASDDGGQTPGARIEQWLPLTAGSHAVESGYWDVWSRIANGEPFDDTCLCDTFLDNGAGLSWELLVPAGGSVVASHLTLFSPLGVQPVVLAKNVSPSTTAVGGQVSYEISVANVNLSPVTISVTDALPDGFTFVPGSTSGLTTSDPAVAGNELTWTDLAVPGDTTAVLAFGVVTSLNPGTYLNSATGSGEGITVVPTGPTAPVEVVGVSTNTLTVELTGSGSGSVVSSPAGIDCPTTCTAEFADDESVTLVPTSDAASAFAGWSGACSGSGVCDVVMDQARSVSARFDRQNAAPVVDAGGAASGVEGSSTTLASASVSDADDDPLSLIWSYSPVAGVDTGATCTFADPSALATTVTCTDDGEYSLSLSAEDGVNQAVVDSTTLTVTNAAPSVSVSSPADGSTVEFGRSISLVAPVGDAGSNDTHDCSIDWGDGTIEPGVVASGSCTGEHTYGSLSMPTVTVTATDDDGGVGSDHVTITVSSDLAKVTGGGWFRLGDGTRVSLGLVAGDLNGRLQGQVQVRVHNDGRFHGTTVDELASDRNSATFSGLGRWNGQSGYRYVVTVTDTGTGRSRKTAGPDTVAITVLDAGGAPVFEASGALDGGNLRVH